ncbi:MAG: hypothetical protein INQ03_04560 [Candidatus Heimdallarchaeota archaeon]|nr:hypothetical protein [Candidatus Heimdallarchaeota archaeon]
MSNNNNTLTSVLVGGMKGTFKATFILFIIGMLVVGSTVSAAEPQMDVYNLSANTKKSLGTFEVDSNEPVQIGLALVDGVGDLNFWLYHVTYKVVDGEDTIYYDSKVNGAEEVLDLIYSVHDQHEFFDELNLDDGTYKSVVQAERDVQVMFGISQLNHGAVFLSAILIALFGVSMALFWTIFPFAMMVLFINAISGNEPTPSRTRSQRVQSKEPFAKRAAKPFMEGNSNSVFHKLTNKDWGWLGLAVIMFFLSFVTPEGPFFFFTVITVVAVFYGMTEREKLKDRIVVLLRHYPETSVEFLKTQLGKKKDKDIIDVLQMMILDEALPIQLNLQNNMVKLVGKIPETYNSSNRRGHIHQPIAFRPVAQPTPQPVAQAVAQPQVTQTPAQVQPTNNINIRVEQPPTQTTQPRPLTEQVEKQEPAKKEEAPLKNFCTGCGTELIAKVAYCYACGQKV